MGALSNNETAHLAERWYNSQYVWNKENRAAEKDIKPDRTNSKSRKICIHCGDLHICFSTTDRIASLKQIQAMNGLASGTNGHVCTHSCVHVCVPELLYLTRGKCAVKITFTHVRADIRTQVLSHPGVKWDKMKSLSTLSSNNTLPKNQRGIPKANAKI